MSEMPEVPEEAAEENRQGLPAWALPVGFIAVVVVLAAVALLRGDTIADPTRPEGAVQLYLQGVKDRDWERAYVFLDPETFGDCDPEDIASGGFQEDFDAVHERTVMRNGRASVAVTMRFGEGGFLGGGWANRYDFDTVQRDGFWYVTGDPWPHFRWACTR